MKRLYGMLLRSFVPLFAVAVLFFILILQIMDLFGSLSRYLAHGVPALQVLRIALLYLPKCVSYSLPIAFLFGVTFTLGLMYTNNELFAIFGSGISLTRLVLPFIAVGALLSAGGFFLEDLVVIPSLRERRALYAVAVKLASASSQANAVVLSGADEVVYMADYYNDNLKRLDGVTLVVRRRDGVLDRRIDAQWGEWKQDRWVFHACRIFVWDPARAELTDFTQDVLDSPAFSEPPETFRHPTRSVTEMTRAEAETYVTMLRRTGFPSREALTDYYRKFSFACTPIIVALIASSLGGWFRKNILLMSLLSVLAVSVVYYVAQMLAATLSKYGYIPPLAAAWSPFTVFLLLGAMLFRTART